MSTIKDIQKTEQSLARLERNHALQQIKKRKQETRRKIEFGGLVVKSQMNGYPKDIILGALIDAKQHLESDDAVKRLFALKGRDAFLEKEL